MKLDRLALERKRTLIRVGRSGAASLSGHLHTTVSVAGLISSLRMPSTSVYERNTGTLAT